MKKKSILKGICSLMVAATLATSFQLPAVAAGQDYSAEQINAATLPEIKSNIDATNSSKLSSVKVSGTAYTKEVKALIDQINTLRKEACEAGNVPVPGNEGKVLTKDDYVPIQWSLDLEAVALQRAAEANVYRNSDFKRPNNYSYNLCKTVNGISPNKEVLHYPSADDCVAAAFDATTLADEKSKWITDKKYTSAPLYSNLINPNYTYIGVAGFMANESEGSTKEDTRLKTVATEFGIYKSTDNLKTDYVGTKGATSVKMEVAKDMVTDLTVNDGNTLTVNLNSEKEYFPNATVKFSTKFNSKDYVYTFKSKVNAGAIWESLSTEYVTVKDGKLCGIKVTEKGQDAKVKVTVGNVTKTIAVKVKPADLSSQVKVEGFKSKLPYNYGKDVVQPEARVYLDSPSGKIYLTEGTDYDVKYKNNTEVGTATFIVKAINDDLKGSFEKTFKITPLSLSASEGGKPLITISVSENNLYTKGGCNPKISVSYNGYTLVEGRDYTVKYKNAQTSLGTAVVKGKKNYNSKASTTYKIINAPIEGTTLYAKDIVYKPGLKTKKALSKPAIYDTNGKKLKAGKDYNKTVVYTYADTGEIVKNTDIFQIGTTVSVNATAVAGSHYTGSVSGTYRIVEASIAKAKITCNTSSPSVNITAADLTVTLKNVGTLVADRDYEIQSATLNKKGTKLTVVIHGIGKYGLTKKVTIKL